MTSPKGVRLLFDPFLTNNPSCPPAAKRVGTIDLILVTHGHSDHCEDAAAIARDTGATVVASPELAAWLERQGVKHLRPMNIGGRQHVVRPRHRDGAGGAQQQRAGRQLPWPCDGIRRPLRRWSDDLFRRRHGALRRYAPHPRSAFAACRVSADRRSLHDGTRRCGDRRGVARCEGDGARCTTERFRS